MKTKLSWVLLGVMILAGSSSVFAQQSTSNAELFEKIAKLRQLKESDPEAYQQAIAQKRARVQKKSDQLQQKNPEKFQRLRQKNKQKRKERLAYMKKNQPEKFERFMEKRMDRLQKKAQKNPEKFQRIMERNPQLRDRFRARMDKQQGLNPVSPIGGVGVVRGVAARSNQNQQGAGERLRRPLRNNQPSNKNQPFFGKTDVDGDGKISEKEKRFAQMKRDDFQRNNQRGPRVEMAEGRRNFQGPQNQGQRKNPRMIKGQHLQGNQQKGQLGQQGPRIQKQGQGFQRNKRQGQQSPQGRAGNRKQGRPMRRA